MSSAEATLRVAATSEASLHARLRAAIEALLERGEVPIDPQDGIDAVADIIGAEE